MIDNLKELFNEVLDKYEDSETGILFELGYSSQIPSLKEEVTEYRNKWDKIIEEMKEVK